MGIFDFLSDLSSKRAKELDLGGLKSLLGTRKAAEAGLRGDEMMKITGNDSLPGYFNPETREYVPWYVDLFDGGGLNQSKGLLGNDAQEIPTAVGLLRTNGAPVQRAAQMAPQMRPVQSDMPNTGMTGIPGYTLPQSDMPNTGMTGIPGYTLPQSDMPNTGMTGIPGYTLPQSDMPNTGMTGIPGYTLPQSDMPNTGMTGIPGYTLPQADDPEYQEFIRFLKNAGGFERELQDPEWLMRTFEMGKAKGRL